MEDAGVSFMAVASDVDEDQIKSAADSQNLLIEDLTLKLAYAKAEAVSQRYPYSYVLGADQILVCETRRFDKPKNMAQVRDHLRYLRAKEHRLVNGLVILKGSEIVWSHREIATLVMRDFTDAFLDKYLQSEGKQVLGSVGGYLLEGQGSQLFEEIRGDYFTILGLPLLPLLAYLRHIHILDA